jgi:endonuclease-8
VPEGDTIFRTARTLDRALAGRAVTRFETVVPHLSRVEVDSGVTGRALESAEAQGKWLLIRFSGDLILLTHMLMSGSWHIYRPGERWRRPRIDMRIVLETTAILAVAFNVRIAEFHSTDSLRRREGFNTLGQPLLAPRLNEAEGVTRLRLHPDREVGAALLDQSIVAGIGNVFKSETCFVCGIHPFRLVRSLSDGEAASLIATARKLLQANVANVSGDHIVTYGGFRRTTGRSRPEDGLWVYHRAGEPCRRCSTPIESRKQGLDARTTFWCPRCQPMTAAAARLSL